MMENNAVKNIIMAILFFVFLGLIIVGQKTVSVANLHVIHRPCGIARSAVFIQQKIQITGGNKNG